MTTPVTPATPGARPSIRVDADACPAVLRDVLFRAAERTHTPMTLVANMALRTPPSPYIRALQVARGFDVADEQTLTLLAPDGLVVTSDIPLAAQAIARGARVLDMRGHWVDANTVADRLATRDLLAELRDLGHVGGRAGAAVAGGSAGVCEPVGPVLDGAAAARVMPESTLTVYAFPRWKWRHLRRCFPGRARNFVEQGARGFI